MVALFSLNSWITAFRLSVRVISECFYNHHQWIQVLACSVYIVLSTCKLPDTLVGWTVDDWLGGLAVVDCPPVLPILMKNVVSIITAISGIGVQCLCFSFSKQVTWYTSWFYCGWLTRCFTCWRWSPCFP